MNLKDIIELLSSKGLERITNLKTAYPIMQMKGDQEIKRVYAPALDKKGDKIAISGIVGIIDQEFQKTHSSRPLIIKTFGRHMLSITAEAGIAWYIDAKPILIEERINLVFLFMDKLPSNRMQLLNMINNGELDSIKAVFNKKEADEYSILN